MFSYILHKEGGTSCHIWTGLAPLFHLVLMVVSLEDISWLLWVSQDGATSRGVSLCSQWNKFLIGEIVISLIHLQFSQSFQWMWANKNHSGCGHDVMTCWLEWGKYLSCSVVMAFIVICHHVSKYTKPWGHWKLWQWLYILTSLTRFVYGASTASPTENYSSLKSLLGGLEAHTPCFTPWKNQSNLVVHPPP